VPLMKVGSYRKNALGALETWGRLRQLMRQGNFDLVHTHKRYSDFLGRILTRLFKKPHVSTCHNTFERGRWYSPFGDHTIAVSEAIRGMLVKRFAKRDDSVTVILNGIPPLRALTQSRVKHLHHRFGIAAHTPVILCVGQFIPAKGHSTLIEALRILDRQEPRRRWSCVLAGHGELRAVIEAKIHDDCLKSRITIVDGTEDLENLFALADFGVLPSVRDGGIPYTIMEGASLKKPFIASCVGGVPEFIEHEINGILVPANDSSALADRIEYLLRNPRKVRIMGQYALEHYVRHHSTNVFVDQTIAVYDRALQTGL